MRTPDMPAGGRRNGAAIIAALTVAAILVGSAAISMPGSPDRRPSPQSATTVSAPASVIKVDLGPTPDDEAVEACAGEEFVEDPAQVEVLYDVVQLAPAGTSAVLVLRNPAGDVRLCDAAGADVPAVLPLPATSADRPLAFLTTGTAEWNCDGQVLGGFRSTTWLLVHEQVAEVQQRFVVDGEPGPWFSSAPSAGIAHLQTWLGPQPEGVEIVSEQRALDAAGDVVPQDVWPRRQPLEGCPAGADTGEGPDVQIG